MWEFFQYVMGFICLLLGLIGGSAAACFSQESTRTYSFAMIIMLAGVGWAGAMAYIAYRLFGFQ